MTAQRKIEDFLRQNPDRAFCDDCLSQTLDIYPRQQVQHKTYRLARDSRFVRQRGYCHNHGRDNKKVIYCALASTSPAACGRGGLEPSP
jgi:hypothetical protein